MNKYLDKLNDAQLEAVTSSFQHIRVIAGAGSGKTKVLTSRIAYLVDNNVEEDKILAITFTNKAAKEMKTRVEKLLNNDHLKAYISTYHSFCARFLRSEISHINFTKNFVILDEQDQIDLVKELKKDFDEDRVVKPNKIIDYISLQKTKRIDPLSLQEKFEEGSELYIKAKTYLLYENYLKENNYLDFDDLIIKTVDILNSFENIRKKYQDKFEHILIDEFQDTNNEEYTLIKLLSKPSTNVFVVGDPDQTIYTWRGANSDIIFNFTVDFKNTKDYVLDLNYRSTQYILDAANALISNNKKRVKKDLVANKEKGSKPIFYEANDFYGESNYIAKNIYEDVKNNKYQYKDYAILYRSNYYSANIEKSLMKLCIPYKIFGTVKFYERKEIKDALAYLRLIISEDDILAFTRIVNVPRRGVGPKKMQEILNNAKELSVPPLKYLYEKEDGVLKDFADLIHSYKDKIKVENNPNFGKILKELLEESGYNSTLDPVDDEDRIENLRELSDILFQYQIDNDGISLDDIISEITLYSAQDELSDGDFVSLMTVHTAKGLEFPVVYVAGLSEGVFPNARSIQTSSLRENDDALEEERRLFYVAMTRAKELLYLTANNGYSYSAGSNQTSSRFIDEIDEKIERYFKKIDYGYNSPKINEAIIQSEVSDMKANDDYHPGNIVIHNTYGEGIIIEMTDLNMKIAFKKPDIGVKLISRKFPGITKKE